MARLGYKATDLVAPILCLSVSQWRAAMCSQRMQLQTKAMGFEPLEIGLFHYANTLGYGTADLDKIDITGPAIEDSRDTV